MCKYFLLLWPIWLRARVKYHIDILQTRYMIEHKNVFRNLASLNNQKVLFYLKRNYIEGLLFSDVQVKGVESPILLP